MKLLFAWYNTDMNFNLDKETKERIKAYSLSGMILATFYVLLTHLNIVAGAITNAFSAVAPFFFGIFFTFILIPLRNMIELKWLKNSRFTKKGRRRIGVILAMVIMLLVIVGFFALIIPQIIDSLSQFVRNFSGYMQNVMNLAEQLSGENQNIVDIVNSIIGDVTDTLTKWVTSASGGFQQLLSTITNVVSVVANFLIGMIIAIYLLLDTEKFKRQSKKLFYSLFPINIADHIVYISKLTSGMFYKFIFGKAIDSLVIGIICYICVKIMNLPYGILIALIIGLTNMIPVFGPFIGAIPCLLILVMINWVYAVEFLIFIVILQQIDGNVIGPYILGDAVGLPTLWVMFAIIVGGAMLGVLGMFIGVPLFAVIYTLVQDWTDRTLKEKNIEFPGEGL